MWLYLEWLVNVPLLMTLVGHCALFQPLTEGIVPVIITEMYILLSLCAKLTKNIALRWSLVAITMISYMMASAGMLRWVTAFLKSGRSHVSSPFMRPLAVVMLIGFFAFYAVVYMLSLLRTISACTEQWSYTCAGVASKAMMGIIFAFIHAEEDNQRLLHAISQARTLSHSHMSIMKGNFDSVLVCEVDGAGVCQLPNTSSAQLQELQHRLGKPVAGVSLEALLAGEKLQERFKIHLRNVLAQAEDADKHCASDSPLLYDYLEDFEDSQTPHAPVSQVQHNAFALDSGDIAPAAIHVAVVPRPVSGIMSEKRHVIVAIDFVSVSSDAADMHAAWDTVYRLNEASLSTCPKGHKMQHSDDTSTADCSFMSTTPDSLPGLPGLNHPVEILRGEDVYSQSSKSSYIGSVHLACRQLLGPLLDTAPPGHCVSKRIDDHLAVAAAMCHMNAPSKVASFQYEQEILNWRSDAQSRSLHNMFQKSSSPQDVDEGVWHAGILPFLDTGPLDNPPQKPAAVLESDRLWEKAFLRTHVDYTSEGGSSASDAGDVGDAGGAVDT
jgi:hypothetical protein